MAQELDPTISIKSNDFTALLLELSQHTPGMIGGVPIVKLKCVIRAIQNIVTELPITEGDKKLVRAHLEEIPVDNGLWACVKECCGVAFVALLMD